MHKGCRTLVVGTPSSYWRWWGLKRWLGENHRVGIDEGGGPRVLRVGAVPVVGALGRTVGSRFDQVGVGAGGGSWGMFVRSPVVGVGVDRFVLRSA